MALLSFISQIDVLVSGRSGNRLILPGQFKYLIQPLGCPAELLVRNSLAGRLENNRAQEWIHIFIVRLLLDELLSKGYGLGSGFQYIILQCSDAN